MTPFRLTVIAFFAALVVKGAETVEIDALSGVIQNKGSQTEVRITSASGTGEGITLAENKVTIGSLVQAQNTVEAVVRMLRENMLLLGSVVVAKDMADLTIGNELSEGALGGVGSGKVEFNVERSWSRIVINSFFTNALTKTAVKGGDGTVVANGDFHASVDQIGGVMAFAVANAASKGELPTLNIAGSGLIYDFDSLGLEPVFGNDKSSVSDSAKEAVLTADAAVPLRGFNVGGNSNVRFEKVNAYQPSAAESLEYDEIDFENSLTVGSNSVGVLTLDGGSLVARLEIGKGASGKGALYLRGKSAVTNVCCSTNVEYLAGNGGFAHIGISGDSEYVSAGMCGFASFGQVGIVITNGRFSTTAESLRRCRVCMGESKGYVSLYVGSNGSFETKGDDYDIATVPVSAAIGEIQFTAENGGVINLRYSKLKSTSKCIFNINDDGIMKAGLIEEMSGGGGGAYFQFNGGMFDSRIEGLSSLDGTIWSFEKGATFNVDFGDTLYSIQAPNGKGLVSIELPDTMADLVFIAPPIVKVNGDGHGATAICELNAEGKVAGFKVVGHGDGYTYGTATLFYGNKNWQINNPYLHFAQNVSGGMTKTGSGTLILKGANTYTGDTVVQQGVIQLRGGSISPLSSLKLYNGGIFDVGGGTQSFSNYGGDGSGAVSNGTVILDGLVFDMNKVKAKEIDTLRFSSNIVFSVSAGVKLLNASESDLVSSQDYVLCNLTGEIPERLPPFDPETRCKLSNPWGIMIRRNGDAYEAVLHYFGGSYFIYY